MSLLNITNDGLPNVLFVIIAHLFEERGVLTESELFGRVAPDGVIGDGGQMVRQTLATWTSLGLFIQTENKLRLAPAYFEADLRARQPRDVLSIARRAVRVCAFAPENNPDLWAREGAKAADLTRALSWLLAQDVYRTNWRTVERQESEQLTDPELRFMQNNTRRNGLEKWAHFLGFTRQPENGDIDPTVAVSDAMRVWEPMSGPVSSSEFIDHLKEDLPVIDGGLYRRQVEQRLNRTVLPELGAGRLSTGLSRALLNLRASGRLVFDSKSDVGFGRSSDTSSIVLTGQGGVREDRRFTHVRVVPERAA